MSEKDINLNSFIRDAMSLGFDVTRVDGTFKDPITTKVKALWDIQQQRNEANATFIKDYLNNPILEHTDNKFVARPIKGMIEFKGQMVFITSSTGLAYEMSLPIGEVKKLKRMVF